MRPIAKRERIVLPLVAIQPMPAFIIPIGGVAITVPATAVFQVLTRPA
jgi:hypothetical protein